MRSKVFKVTPTITAGLYAAADFIGAAESILAEAGRKSGRGGKIEAVVISDKGKQSAPIDVVFFSLAKLRGAADAAASVFA